MKTYVWKVTLRCVDELGREVDVVDYIEAADIDAAVTLAEARAIVRRLALQGTKSCQPGAWKPLDIRELIDRSSVGQAAREMRENPEKHLRELEAEMFPKRKR